MNNHDSQPRYNRVWLTVRSAVFWVWQIINTLVMGLPVMLTVPFSYDLGYRLCRLWLQGNVYGLRVICGVRWKVEGREHIPDKPCLALAKHQSTWETYFLPIELDRATYVAKRSLAWIPIFGWSLWLLRFILIDRSSGRSAVQQMVEQATDRVAKNRWVIIFPEGTRRPVGAEPSYRMGGAIVAEQTGIPVLPVAVNAGEFWPRMGFIKWPGEITVRFGPVIATEGRTAQDIMAETQEWIESNVKDITVLNRFPY